MDLRRKTQWAALLLAGAVWLLLARLSGGNATDPDGSALYLPAGFTLALAITFRSRAAIAPLLGVALDLALRRNSITAEVVAIELTAGIAHAVCYPFAGTVLRRRNVDMRDTGMGDLVRFVAFACVLAPAATGLIHAAAVRAMLTGSDGTFLRTAASWTTRDALAVAVSSSVPFAVYGAWHSWRPLRHIEVLSNPTLDRALACLQVTFLAASMVFAFSLGDADTHPLYLTVPALLWLAATRGHRFAAFGVALFTLALLWFEHSEATTPVVASLRLQVLGTALLTLAVGAQVDDRRRAAAAFARMNQSLELSEARYRSVIENAADGLVVIRADGAIQIANAATERLFGFARERIESMNVASLIPPAGRAGTSSHLAQLLAGAPSTLSGERYWLGRRADNTTFPIRVGVSHVDIGGDISYTLILHDESDRKQYEEQLEHQATHDGLTDLPVRALLNDRLLSELERLRRTPSTLALLLIDLDNFKEVNDTLGHEVGDTVLREVAMRLRDSVRRSDTVARLGGDEFAILLSAPTDQTAAAMIAERTLACLRESIAGLSEELTPTASIGIRMITSADDEPSDILRQADLALYQAKGAGRDRFRFYTTADLSPLVAAEIDLRDSIGRGALTLRYQPVIDARTGRVSSIEALARLQRSDGSLVEPGEFIPLAERSGIIDRLGEEVLRGALRDLYTLRRDINPELHVSVNVSPRQLANRRFPDIVSSALAATGSPAGALLLEITESMELAPIAFEIVRAVAATGVTFAIDDFGTGHTRFSMLRDLPISALKIDREFVRGVTGSGAERDIVATMVSLAQRRGLIAIAEGVETIEMVDQLTALGCSHLQGFLFGKPMPIDELRVVLRRWKALPSMASKPLGPSVF